MNHQPTNQLTKRVYKVSGMDCDACAKMIELDLEDMGVKAMCSYPKEELEVEFDPKKISEEKVFETLKNSDYTISDIT